MENLQAGIVGFKSIVPCVAEHVGGSSEQVARENQYRLYALAFWMTDNELAAERIVASVVDRAGGSIDTEQLDRVFVEKIRTLMPLGRLSLQCATATEELNVRRNTKRVHLERAIVQLPPTERLIFVMHDVDGYDRTKIAQLLGLRARDCLLALHQARLRIRELVAAMVR